MTENNPKIDFYNKGYEAALRAQPDCRAHYTEPARNAYGKGYDAGLRERKARGIDFYSAKALVALEVAAKPNRG